LSVYIKCGTHGDLRHLLSFASRVEHMAGYDIYWVSTLNVKHMAIYDIYWASLQV
jgi:hypothetical protein